METSSLFSSVSTSTTTSTKHRLHLKTLATRLLASQHSRTSLRSERSGSSSLSRALVVWRPRFSYSPNSSRSASVSTIPVYPTRDPTRLQRLTQTLGGVVRNATKAPTAVRTDVDAIIDLYASITEATMAQTFPAPLSSYSREEMKQRALTAIKETVQKYAADADKNIAWAVEQRALIYVSLLDLNELPKDSPFIRKEAFTTVDTVLKASGTVASILVALELLRCILGLAKSIHQVLRILSTLTSSPAYSDNVFCICARVIIHEPWDSVRNLITELSTCWMDNSASHLSSTSPMLMLMKINQYQVLYECEDFEAAEQIWSQVKQFDISASISHPFAELEAHMEFGHVACLAKDYKKAVHILERALRLSLQRDQKDYMSDAYYYLSGCNLELGNYAQALEQVELVLSILSELETSAINRKNEISALDLRACVKAAIEGQHT